MVGWYRKTTHVVKGQTKGNVYRFFHNVCMCMGVCTCMYVSMYIVCIVYMFVRAWGCMQVGRQVSR